MAVTWQNRIAGRTKDRRRYYVFGRAQYVESNVNDDHGRPGREDYSVFLLPVPEEPEEHVVTQPVWPGPWKSWRPQIWSTASSSAPVETVRAAGTLTSGEAAWITRASSTDSSGEAVWVFRAERSQASGAAAWTNRRTGVRTS